MQGKHLARTKTAKYDEGAPLAHVVSRELTSLAARQRPSRAGSPTAHRMLTLGTYVANAKPVWF